MMEDSACTKETTKDFESKGSNVTTVNPDLVTDFHSQKHILAARGR
jgi:hypothetical protein